MRERKVIASPPGRFYVRPAMRGVPRGDRKWICRFFGKKVPCLGIASSPGSSARHRQSVRPSSRGRFGDVRVPPEEEGRSSVRLVGGAKEVGHPRLRCVSGSADTAMRSSSEGSNRYCVPSRTAFTNPRSTHRRRVSGATFNRCDAWRVVYKASIRNPHPVVSRTVWGGTGWRIVPTKTAFSGERLGQEIYQAGTFTDGN